MKDLNLKICSALVLVLTGTSLVVGCGGSHGFQPAAIKNSKVFSNDNKDGKGTPEQEDLTDAVIPNEGAGAGAGADSSKSGEETRETPQADSKEETAQGVDGGVDEPLGGNATAETETPIAGQLPDEFGVKTGADDLRNPLLVESISVLRQLKADGDQLKMNKIILGVDFQGQVREGSQFFFMGVASVRDTKKNVTEDNVVFEGILDSTKIPKGTFYPLSVLVNGQEREGSNAFVSCSNKSCEVLNIVLNLSTVAGSEAVTFFRVEKPRSNEMDPLVVTVSFSKIGGIAEAFKKDQAENAKGPKSEETESTGDQVDPEVITTSREEKGSTQTTEQKDAAANTGSEPNGNNQTTAQTAQVEDSPSSGKTSPAPKPAPAVAQASQAAVAKAQPVKAQPNSPSKSVSQDELNKREAQALKNRARAYKDLPKRRAQKAAAPRASRSLRQRDFSKITPAQKKLLAESQRNRKFETNGPIAYIRKGISNLISKFSKKGKETSGPENSVKEDPNSAKGLINYGPPNHPVHQRPVETSQVAPAAQAQDQQASSSVGSAQQGKDPVKDESIGSLFAGNSPSVSAAKKETSSPSQKAEQVSPAASSAAGKAATPAVKKAKRPVGRV